MKLENLDYLPHGGWAWHKKQNCLIALNMEPCTINEFDAIPEGKSSSSSNYLNWNNLHTAEDRKRQREQYEVYPFGIDPDKDGYDYPIIAKVVETGENILVESPDDIHEYVQFFPSMEQLLVWLDWGLNDITDRINNPIEGMRKRCGSSFMFDIFDMLKRFNDLKDHRRFYRRFQTWIDRVPLSFAHQMQMAVEVDGYQLMCGRQFSCWKQTIPRVDEQYKKDSESDKEFYKRNFRKELSLYLEWGNRLEVKEFMYPANETKNIYVDDIRGDDGPEWRGNIEIFEMVTPEIGVGVRVDNETCTLRTTDEGKTVGIEMIEPRSNPCKVRSVKWRGERNESSEMLGMAF